MKEGKEEFFDEEQQYDNKYSQHNMNIIQHLGSAIVKGQTNMEQALLEKTYRHFFCRP